MKKRITAAIALVLTFSLVLSGCVISRLTEALRDQASKAASEAMSDLSSAASEISEEISEAVSDASEQISEEVSDISEQISEAIDTESEDETEAETTKESSEETETETETETEPEPEKTERPVVLRLLKYETSRYNSVMEDDRYRSLCGMKMEEISLMRDETLSLYPELLEALERKKLDNWKEFQKLHEDLLQAAKSTSDGSSSYSAVLSLGRSDSAVVSYSVEKEYYYAGAVRPWRETVVSSLDSASGKELALSDFVADQDGLIEKLREEVEAYIRDETGNEDAANQAEYFFEDVDPEDMHYSVGYDRISFWFDSGDVLPGAFARFRIDILFSGNEALFTELALNVPENYMVEIPKDSYDAYLLSDGRTLSVSPEWVDEYWFNDLTVSVDDASVETDLGGESIGNAYFLHLDQYGDFVYVVCDDLNGWSVTGVFDVNGSEPVYVGSISEGIAKNAEYEDAYDDEERTAYVTREIPTDPLYIPMGTPIQLLSSYTGYRYYEASEDGMPLPLDYWYTAGYYHTLTMLQDLETEVVDEDGEVLGNRILRTGEQVMICGASLDDRRVELMTDDGAIVAVTVIYDQSVYNYTVNGISIDDLFDGMMFAG